MLGQTQMPPLGVMGSTRSSTAAPSVSQSQPRLSMSLPTNVAASSATTALKQPNFASESVARGPQREVSRMYSGVSTATPGLSPRSMLSTPRTTGNSIADDSVASGMISMMRSNSITQSSIIEPKMGSTLSMSPPLSSPTAGRSMARITSMATTQAGSDANITTKSSEGVITWKGSDAMMATSANGSSLMMRVATNGSATMQSSSTLSEAEKIRKPAVAAAAQQQPHVTSRSTLPRTQESRAIVLNSAPVSLSAASARLPLLQTLLRVGPRFSHRPSELVAMAETLEDFGISTTDAIQSLSDDLACDIGVPLRLVAALKSYTEDPEEWMRNGALQPYQEAAPHNPELTVRAPWTGYPTYEADPRANRLKVFDTLGGFPTQLREQRPDNGRGAVRRTSSKEVLRERRERSISQHRIRLQNARERREEQLLAGGGRARSEEREEEQEDVLQAWKVTRMSSVNLPVGKAGRPFLASCASPRASVEQTKNISLTLPRRDYEDNRLSPRVVAAECMQLSDRSALDSAQMSFSTSMPVAILKRTPVSLGEPLRLPLRSERTPSRQTRLAREPQTART
mmetsp:Transcript_54549/g.130130  ORF Transcript_54549/g.130130 Transcript_54549/m.130130 type:complete len:571 (-) Transcript_54549:240-1952(-)